jgi:hypothetical protein
MSSNHQSQPKKSPNSGQRRQRRRPKGQFSNNFRSGSNNRKKSSKWNRHRLSEHFFKRDFDSRKEGCQCSLRISLGLVGIIEALRAQLNKRIDIVTGFYCADCRERKYGIKRDFHHLGVAADIRVADFPLIDLFLMAETYPEIKGLGINFDDHHLHIDTRKEDNRQTWVEVNNEWILLTSDNRAMYIPTNHDSASSDT